MSTDPMAEIRASFFVECEELMESLQDALVILDEDGGDAETINVVFRAVHSIKGGAVAFGFDALVGFAHRFETVLDQLRAGKLALTPRRRGSSSRAPTCCTTTSAPPSMTSRPPRAPSRSSRRSRR